MLGDATIDFFGQPILTSDLEKVIKPFQDHIFKEFGEKVLGGPFKGMIISPHVTWYDCSIVSKLFGNYEPELYEHVETAITRNPRNVINVGCSAGYYTIGFARRLPNAAVHGFDKDKRSLDLLELLANKNGVAHQIRTCIGCDDPEELHVSSIGGPYLYFLDCEGAEFKLLDPRRIPTLKTSDLIIEYHAYNNNGTVAELCSHFGETHDILNVSRTPIADSLVFGARWLPPPGVDQPIVRSITLGSGPTGDYGWLVCWAKNHG
jgi:Methyltransferase small domain